MWSLIKKIFNIITSLIVYYLVLLFVLVFRIKKKQIWLISERGTDARDNGWHFYNFMKDNHPEITVKYVIDKKSSDLKKIREEDRIQYRSLRHYFLYITSEKLISTHIMGFSPEFSLFWRLDKKGLIILRGKKIFLQHGITQNYIPIMSKNASKLDLFTCGAKPEYEYVLEKYGYDDSVVKYTGFPRFDSLVSRNNKQILVMPTWRRYLKYENNFKESDYYKAWQSLLNNKDLSKYLKDNNITLVFYPHYEIQKYLKDFHIRCDNIVLAKSDKYDVQQLLKESSILITDYSSVFFDFAYMDKPVIYYQFDYEDFREKHYMEGYYDYFRDGFGPVLKTEDELIDAIINNRWDDKKYKKRVNRFFTVKDRSNCERVYREILNLDAEGDN